jgi:hypothetical protein
MVADRRHAAARRSLRDALEEAKWPAFTAIEP